MGAAVKDGDRTDILITVGALALFTGLTDLILRYLRPGMRPLLVLAGACLVVIGAIGAVLDSRKDDHTHADHRPSRVGWLLLAPVVVWLLFSPGALGSYAVSQRPPFQVTDVDFDLAEHIRTHSFQGQAPDLQVFEFVTAAFDKKQRHLLETTTVRLSGFITHFNHDSDRVYIGRLRIGCCAGDAISATVELQGKGEELSDDTWVEVAGNLDRKATQAVADWESPVMHVQRLRRIPPPAEPYEYTR
jgi:uncharacterized repeat protein (TIGR03943 family)